MTRVYARLLGPCFKTGRRDDQLLHRGSTRALPHHQDQPTRPSRMRPAKQLARQHDSAFAPSRFVYMQQKPYSPPVGSKPEGEASPDSWQALHHTPQRTSPANALADRIPHTPMHPERAHRHAARSRLAEYGLVRWLYPFPSYRFHVLLNSLFKVLFNFPSRYLFAIGFVAVFSLRWSLPPTLGCVPKQPDSK